MEVSDVVELLQLCTSLNSLDSASIQININKYLEKETCAETAVIVPIERLERDSLLVQVIGTQRRTPVKSIPVERVIKEQLDHCKVIHLRDLTHKNLEELKIFLGVDIQSFVSIPIASPAHHKTNEGPCTDHISRLESRNRSSQEAQLIVCLVNKKTGPEFTERDVKLVYETFRVCAGVLLNAMAYEEERRIRGQFHKLLTVARRLFTHLDDVTVLLRQIMAEARMLTQAERCSLFLVDRKARELIAKVFDGNAQPDGSCEQGPEVRLPLGQGIAGHVATTGELVNIKEAYDHPLFYKGVDEDTGFKTKNILCFPICDDTGVIGVAELCNKENGTCFTKHDEEMALAFSSYCGLAIMHSLLYKRVADAQYRSRLSNELMMYHMKVPDDEVQQLVTNAIPDISAIYPKFSHFEFSPRKIPLPESARVVFSMFKTLGLIQRWRIPEETLCRFILMVRRGYRDPPYHNWSHAFSVTHFCYLLLNNLNLMQRKIISGLEGLSLLVGALCHDVDHRGTNNSFQISSNSVLAALYSSEGSVMERHHFAQSMCILNTDGCNILENVSKQEYTQCLDLLQENIMATDIAHHFRIEPRLTNMARVGYEAGNQEHRSLLASLVMTASDLSDQTKDWSNSKLIAKQIYTEFFTQGDLEKAMGNQPSETMDREKAFIPKLQLEFLNKIAVPVYRILSDLFPESREPYEAVCRNLEYWVKAKAVLQLRGVQGDVMEIFMDSTLDSELGIDS